MGDLIDRYAALNELENIDCSDGVGLSALKCDVVEDAISAIKALPSAQPGWIPCRTALPKEDGQYIVTVKYEHVDGYEDIYSEHGEWVDGHWDAGYGHCGRVEKVLAWQPLPTPYREGGQS